jgi:hypothetical protein
MNTYNGPGLRSYLAANHTLRLFTPDPIGAA